MKTGISFPAALFLLFLGLKLCAVIDWSWWWVTAPLWGPPAAVITAAGIAAAGVAIGLVCVAIAGFVGGWLGLIK